jgi:glutathione S-transferase
MSKTRATRIGLLRAGPERGLVPVRATTGNDGRPAQRLRDHGSVSSRRPERRRDQESLVQRARKLLAPSLRTLAAREFLFGATPTLADAALYGVCMMLEEADPHLLSRVAEPLVPFLRRVERHARAA